MKLILRTRGSWNSVSATSAVRREVIRLTTPAGTPASCMMRTISIAVSGVALAGLTIARAAGGQGRAELAGHHRRREVPGRDRGGHADGLAQHQDALSAG